MKVSHLSVVTLDYTVSDEAGEVLDSTEGREPLVYLHGAGFLVPGLEKALYDREPGDSFELKVDAADAYGEYHEELVQEVPGELFDGMEVAEGDTFVADTDDGHRPVTVVEVSEEFVKVDANHPLAGVNLQFAVTVRDVRAATAEEIAHGHVHGGGCCGGHDHDHGDEGCCGGHGHDHGHEHGGEGCCGGHGHQHAEEEEHQCCGGGGCRSH
ncbi:peptidylprolyl isomerase [Pseudaeromonas paramecii]|uniref:Peptidyl-prolyl cis-trans isomerase n=1 Tax=Pseudaeromonas paramecii TaxID=2138166 RepID=A0ABP8QC47_9GAMM